MKQEHKKLPNSELEVMLVIWQNSEPIHTGEIFQRLDPDRNRRIQAIQIVLSRLLEKGYIRCEKVGRLNYYTALVQEEEYRTQETASFINKLYGNSPARLMVALVKEHSLTEQDIAEIRTLLEKGGEA